MLVRELALDTLTLEQSGAVLTARYSSPPHNFVTVAFVRDLDLLTRAVDRDDSVGAVVLTGGVEGCFLTHADPTELAGAMIAVRPPVPTVVLSATWRIIRQLVRVPVVAGLAERAGGPMGQALVWGYRWRAATLRMNRSSTVYIAAINGPTTGGGQEIALACDLRFASDAATVTLGQIEARANLIPGGGGTQRLPRMLGSAVALEMMLEGTTMGAQEAHERGLVNAVVADEDLVKHAQQTAARLARRSAVTIREIKRLNYFAATGPFPRGLDDEMGGFLATGMQPTMPAVLEAFTEDLAEQRHSPLIVAESLWSSGQRVNLRHGTC